MELLEKNYFKCLKFYDPNTCKRIYDGREVCKACKLNVKCEYCGRNNTSICRKCINRRKVKNEI